MEKNIYSQFSHWKAFGGYYRENKKIKNSASGGAATALSELMISKGGIVIGVKYTDDFKGAEYNVAKSKIEIEQFKTSKYIVPAKNVIRNNKKVNIFEIVANNLKNKTKVLFIGLGCDVGALYYYLKQNAISMEGLITVDLICHGPTFPIAQQMLIEELERKYKAKTISMSVKYKKNGWIPPYMLVCFDNGKKYLKPFYDSDLGYAMEHFFRESCSHCNFKGNHHKADITIGDYWGIDEKFEYFNKMGVSVLLTQNKKGLDYIYELDNREFFLFPADTKYVLENNKMFFQSRKSDSSYDLFKRRIEKYGLRKTVLINRGIVKSLLLKPKRIVSNMLSTRLRNKIKQWIHYGS